MGSLGRRKAAGLPQGGDRRPAAAGSRRRHPRGLRLSVIAYLSLTALAALHAHPAPAASLTATPNGGNIDIATSGVTLGAGTQAVLWGGGPYVVGSVDTPGSANGVTLNGAYAYVADGAAGIEIIDRSNPAAPAIVDIVGSQGPAMAMVLSPPVSPPGKPAVPAGKYGYVAAGSGGLAVLDLSSPGTPTLLKSTLLGGAANDAVVNGTYLYVAVGGSGLDVFDLSNDPSAPAFVGSLATLGDGQGVAASGSDVYVATGGGGLAVIDVSTPGAPNLLAFVHDMPGFAAHVAVAGNYAYVADGRAGLQIVNLLTDTVAAAVPTPSYAKHVALSATDTAHVYVADNVGGLEVIQVGDVTAPADPHIQSSVSVPRLAQSVTIEGNDAYLAAGQSGLHIIDIAHPARPSLAQLRVGGAPSGIAVANDFAYVANGRRGVQVVDVAAPQSPAVVATLATPDSAAGVAVAGDTLYVADKYGGLQLIDLTQATHGAAWTCRVPVTVATPGSAAGVAVLNATAYVADMQGGLQVIDVSQATPRMVGSVAASRPVYAVAARDSGGTVYVYAAEGRDGLQVMTAGSGGWSAIYTLDTNGTTSDIALDDAGRSYIYLADGDNGVVVMDISSPERPRVAATVPTPRAVSAVTEAGGVVYATTVTGVVAIDVTDPGKPVMMGPDERSGYPQGLAVDGVDLFVTLSSGIVARIPAAVVVDIPGTPPANPFTIATPSQLPANVANDILLNNPNGSPASLLGHDLFTLTGAALSQADTVIAGGTGTACGDGSAPVAAPAPVTGAAGDAGQGSGSQPPAQQAAAAASPGAASSSGGVIAFPTILALAAGALLRRRSRRR